jgi:hypothetical protein
MLHDISAAPAPDTPGCPNNDDPEEPELISTYADICNLYLEMLVAPSKLSE